MASRYAELENNQFHISVARDSRVRQHGHDFLELSYITRGNLRHDIDGQQSALSPGDYFIVDHGTEHGYRQLDGEPLEVVNLLFYPSFLDRTLSGSRRFADVVNSYLLRFRYETLRSSPTGKTFHDSDGSLGLLVERMAAEYNAKAPGYLEYCRCLLVEILIATMRKIGSDTEDRHLSAPVREIMDYVKAHYAQPILLGDIAKQWHYSLSGLSKKFSDEVGMGFSQYLQRIRVEQSCRLLETTDLRISEIAQAVGYGNVKFFNQIFKDTLGASPREFRRRRK